MTDKIRITWEASDGYAGGSAPQHFKVDLEDYEKGAELEDIKTQLSDDIQRDFEEKVTWTCDLTRYAQEIYDALNQPK